MISSDSRSVSSMLEEIGLTNSESKVYIALSKNGPRNVSTIAQLAGLHRAAAYNTLNQLSSKGIVGVAVVDGHKVYHACSIDELKVKIEEKLEKTKLTLAEIAKAFSSRRSEQPVVSAYFGKEGVKTVLNQELEAAGKSREILVMKALPQLAQLMPVFVSSWHKKRASKGIEYKALYDKSEKSLERAKELKKLDNVKVKHLSVLAFEPVTYHLAGDLLCIISAASDLFAVAIKSKEITRSFKQTFDSEWRKAK